MELKDIDKAFPLTAKCVRVFSKTGKLLIYDEIKSVGRFGVVSDFTIDLMKGVHIDIDAGIAKLIAQEYLKRNKETK